MKFDQLNGLVHWATQIGEETAGANYYGHTVATDGVGNIYIGGNGIRQGFSLVTSTGYSQSTQGLNIGFLAKFDNMNNDMVWSTMFGNNGTIIHDMNTTIDGDLYITGETDNLNNSLFPFATNNVNDYQQAFAGGKDAFLARFTISTDLMWSTVFGGDQNDFGYGINFSETNGDVYLVGGTYSDSNTFPLVDNGDPLTHFSNSTSLGQAGFVTVFENNSMGFTPKYSSYYGGTEHSWCEKVEVTNHGAAYITGNTRSLDLPLNQLVNGYFQPIMGNTSVGGFGFGDGFVLALGHGQLHLEWSTYFGGDRMTLESLPFSVDQPKGIAVYNSQTLYIGGRTPSTDWFPITVDLVLSPNAYIQYNNAGYIDGFISQFDLMGTALSIEKLNLKSTNSVFTVFPNPSPGDFKLTSSHFKSGSLIIVEVRNVIGQLVYRKTANVSNASFVHNMNISKNASGLYLVTLRSGKKTYTKRLILDN